MYNTLNDEYYLIYLRKSRADNKNETVEEVLSRHEQILQDFAVRTFGHKIDEQYIYRERVSGETINDRPVFQEILSRIQDVKCLGVLVVDAQRTSRGDWEDGGKILSSFKYSKTLIITPRKTFNLNDKNDYKLFKMELTSGNEYLEYSVEKMKDGRDLSASKGYFVGSIPPYGYDRMETREGFILVKNENEAPYVQLVFDLYVNQGYGAQKICNYLNELHVKTRHGNYWKPVAIRQMLTNEVYYGVIRWGNKKVVRTYDNGNIVKKRPRSNDYQLFDGQHEGIISKELFEKAKERKGQATKEKVDYELQNEFAGLIKCKKCGGAIALRVHRKNGVKLRADRFYCRGGIHCSNMSTNAEIVKEAIIETLKIYLEDFEIKAQKKDNSHELHLNIIESIERDLLDIEKREARICDLAENDESYPKELFLKRITALYKERDELRESLKKAKETMPKPVDYEEKCYTLQSVLVSLSNPNISAKNKNKLLKSIIDVIYYEKDESDKKNNGKNVKLEIHLKP